MDWLALLIPIVAVVAVFTFVAVATWSDNRRKERETFNRHETYRRMLEQPSESAAEVLALMRREEAQRQRQRIEAIRLGGMITTIVGVGLMIFFYVLFGGMPIYMVGIIPLLIGLVLMVYGFFMMKEPEGSGPDASIEPKGP
jgi:Flp pilus assembly protein TadB